MATINVTAEQIERAKASIDASFACRASCCPIALACKDQGLPLAFVGTRCIYLHPEQVSYTRIPLPHIAQVFIEEFDNGSQCHPISFDVEIPQPQERP